MAGIAHRTIPGFGLGLSGLQPYLILAVLQLLDLENLEANWRLVPLQRGNDLGYGD